MYRVEVIATDKEVVETEVDAIYCLVDEHNNLVFENDLPLVTLKPVAMFSARRWISAQKVEIRRASSSSHGIPLR